MSLPLVRLQTLVETILFAWQDHEVARREAADVEDGTDPNEEVYDDATWSLNVIPAILDAVVPERHEKSRKPTDNESVYDNLLELSVFAGHKARWVVADAVRFWRDTREQREGEMVEDEEDLLDLLIFLADKDRSQLFKSKQ